VVGTMFDKTNKNQIQIKLLNYQGASTLYIGLGVLLPEMMEDFENTRSFKAKVKITIAQLSGFITGYMIMIVLNMYEENIQI
jgi:hypothetical protein